jgi:presenilin-like A22 family membrane protease
MEDQEKKIKNIFFLFPLRVFLFEFFFFSLILILGIFSAFRVNEFLKFKKVLPPTPSISLWQFLFYFTLITSFVFLLSFFGKKYKKGRDTLFKIVFVLAVCFGGLITINIWLGNILALILTFILIYNWLRKPIVFTHDLILILGIAGLGVSLGLSISPLVVVSLLIIFSIYDFIAVYQTKHMIKIAKEMMEAGAILALIFPQKISDFKASLKEVKPGGKFLILGGGDVAFPLLLCVSLIPQGIFDSLIVAFFSWV